MRIAARPSQVVPAHPRLAALLHRAQRFVRLGVGGEAEQHLVQLDVVQHLCAEILEAGGEAPRMTAAALDHVGDPGASERADRGVHR